MIDMNCIPNAAVCTQEPLVSVIVPIYKVEKYLETCIESILCQTYKNLEIILVDDGSPDGCPQICDAYAKKDSRIVVVHKENGGLSSARNAGLDICQGEYICFVDSDDWIAFDMVEVLIRNCEKHGVQIAVCGRYDIFDRHNKQLIGKNPCQDKVIDSRTATAQMLLGLEFDSSAWGKLYCRSLWQNIRFPYGKIYEDVAILYKVVLGANGVALVSKPMYCYFRHSQSITTSVFTEAVLDYPSNTRNLLHDLQENNPDLYEYACWTHTKAIEYVLARLAKADKKQYKQYIVTFKHLSEELSSYKSTWRSSAIFARKDVLLCYVFSHWRILRPLFQLKIFLKKQSIRWE